MNDISFIKKFSTLSTAFLILGIIISFIVSGDVPLFHFVGILFILITLLVIYSQTLKLIANDYVINDRRIFFYALLVRLIFIPVIGYILINLNGFPFASDKDDFIYNEIAVSISKNWDRNNPNFSTGISMSTGFYSGFPTFSAFLMWVFGKEWWIPRIGNAFLSAFTVVYFAKTCRLIFKKEQIGLVILLMIYSPIFVTFSSLQLKDTLLLFIIASIFYFLVYSFKNGFNPKTIAILILLFTALIFVRAATIPPLLIASVVSSLYITNTKIKFISRFWKLTTIAIVIYGVLYLWSFLGKYGLIDSPEVYFGMRYDSLESESTGSGAGISSSNLAYLLSTPLFIVGSVLLPIPLAVELAGPPPYFTNYNYTANIFLYAMIPLVAPTAFIWIKKRREYPIFLFFILFFFLYKIGQAFSLSLFNIRQGLPAIFVMHFFLPLLTIGKPSKKIYLIFIVLLVIAMFAYAFVRLNSKSNIG